MIDTHCHIFSAYYDDIDAVINKMGNNILIVSGTNDFENAEVIKLCDKYRNVYGTLGIHPTEISNITPDSFRIIEEGLVNHKIVGVGEIGLDYYWNKEDKEKQKEIFIKQILLARNHGKAIVVHSRDALDDTYEIIKKYAGGMKVDIHCFSSSIEQAMRFIKLGCRLGIGGVLTFKNNVKLKDVVAKIDLEHILLETDSPYLTPEPFRGQKNEPYNVLYVAQKIAEIKNIDVSKILEITTQNAISQFDLEGEI